MVTTMRAERPARSRFGKPSFLYSIAKPGLKMCSRKPLNNAGMVPRQKGKQIHLVLRPTHVLPRLRQSRRQRTGLEIQLRAQECKLELSDLDAADLVPRCDCSFGISVSHRVQQVMPRRIWMALDNRDAPTHLSLPQEGLSYRVPSNSLLGRCCAWRLPAI